MNDFLAPWPARPSLPCAWGDAFDRLTILQLKVNRFTDSSSLVHAREEHASVLEAIGNLDRFPQALSRLVVDLGTVNAALWDTENALNTCEAEQRFGDGFVTLARRVYTLNAERARIKQKISLLLGSTLVEQKQYGPAS